LSFGAVFPHFCPDKREVWHGERGASPLQGEKPIFGPLSKNNTGMAALHTGLPVKRIRAKVNKDVCIIAVG